MNVCALVFGYVLCFPTSASWKADPVMLGEMDKSYQSKFLRHLYNAQMKLENKFAIQPDTLSFLSYVSLDLELGM